jgi:uncharacterized protein (DUF1786 family)
MKPKPIKRTRRPEKAVLPSRPQFQINAFYENLIVLRNEKPEVFERLSSASQAALRFYEAAKANSEALDRKQQSTTR